MNRKRGETQTANLVPLLVGLAVLGLLVYAVYHIGQWQGWWAKNLPVPGQQNVAVNIPLAEFRYLPASDRVEYYTSTAWEKFDGKNVDIGNTRIYYDSFRKSFKGYYYGIREPQQVTFPDSSQDKIYPASYGPAIRSISLAALTLTVIGDPQQANDEKEQFSFWGKIVKAYNLAVLGPASVVYATRDRPYERGDVLFVLINGKDTSDTKPYGSVVVDANGKVWFQRLKKDLSTPDAVSLSGDAAVEPFKTLVEKAALWRDSVLKKPISLTITQLEGSKEVGSETKQYCLEKIVYQGEISLIVRLEQFTTKGSCL